MGFKSIREVLKIEIKREVNYEQVFMSNISILADAFKHRLETITHMELILLVILGAILFKKMY